MWRWLSNVRLAPKLLSSVVLLSIVAISLAALGLSSLTEVHGSVETLQGLTARLQSAGGGTSNMLAFVRNVEYLPLELTAEQRKDYENGAVDELARFETRLGELEKLLRSEENRSRLKNVRDALERYRPVYKAVLEQSRANNLAAATDTALKGAPLAAEMRDNLRGIETTVERRVAEASRSAADTNAAAHWTLLLVSAVGIAVAGGISVLLVVFGVVRPLTGMAAAMTRVAGGDLDTPVPALGQKDEVGQLAGALEQFKVAAHEARRVQAERAEVEARAAAERRAAMLHLAESFERSVGVVVGAVAAAATEMEQSAQSLSAIAEQSSRQATTVAAASEQASVNVQTVASGSEELAASIAEIARQVNDSSQIANQAVDDARRTNETVEGLAAAASKIGEVVKLIQDIAAQTNLLALNATIEAARAGEAGKGFAVVASEVKSLANQTAKATEEIATQIGSIQGATGAAVDAIRSIGGTIGRIDEIAATIAAAVEEQGAATQEIARNVQQAAAGTSQVSSTIIDVTRAATETGAAAGQVLGAAGELSRQSVALRSEVDAFLATVRAA